MGQIFHLQSRHVLQVPISCSLNAYEMSMFSSFKEVFSGFQSSCTAYHDDFIDRNGTHEGFLQIRLTFSYLFPPMHQRNLDRSKNHTQPPSI